MSYSMPESCEAQFISLVYHCFLSTSPEAPREEAWEFAHEQWGEYQGALRLNAELARPTPSFIKSSSNLSTVLLRNSKAISSSASSRDSRRSSLN